MWKYYIKMAWRNFKTNKLFSFLNLAGLSIGIAICIPLFLFVRSELSFDGMYQNKNDIYRVNLKTLGGGAPKGETWACVPNSVAPVIMENIPEVRSAARMLKNGFGSPASLKIGNVNYKEDNLFWCDPELFDIFEFDFIAGNKSQPLKEVNDVVISESESKRLFDEKDPIGQIITVDNKQHLVVKGVFKDLPVNSTIDCSIIANFEASGYNKNLNWGNASFETYCLLNKGADLENVQKELEQLINRLVDDKWFSLELQPFSRVHLYSAAVQQSYNMHSGNIKMVRNLSFLGLLVLLIACINYMNLATARSGKRSKEVGINKTLGASRTQMVWRFYMDTAFIALLAIILGFLLSFGSIFLFNMVTGKHLLVSGLFEWSTFLCLFLLWIFITLISGSYPALLLSAATALQLMQRKFTAGGMDKLLRKSLVVIQYSCSIILIIAVLVISQQMKFIGNQDLGFKPDGVISLNISGIQDGERFGKLRNDLLNLSEVVDVAVAQAAPGYGTSGRTLHITPDDQGYPLHTSNADGHILETLGMKLIAGQNLPSQVQKGDTTCYLLVNKQLVDILGFTPEEALGKRVDGQLGDNAIIRGVVDNFNYASLKDPIGAYAYYATNQSSEPFNVLLVRVGPAHLVGSLEKMEAIFKNDIPNAAFDYQFLDARLASLYTSEKVMEKSAVLFSVLAIFVSCLGLFGLSAFMAEQRFKEVGIRKVLGATAFSITRLLSVDFLKLVLLAIVIGIPVAIWLMNSWLQHFTYRIDITWPLLASAAIIGIAIAIFTICFQAIKAARANPVKSLKTE